MCVLQEEYIVRMYTEVYLVHCIKLAIKTIHALCSSSHKLHLLSSSGRCAHLFLRLGPPVRPPALLAWMLAMNTVQWGFWPVFFDKMMKLKCDWPKIRQSKINSRSVTGPMGQMNRQPSVWCSKYYFFSWFLAEFFAKILSIYTKSLVNTNSFYTNFTNTHFSSCCIN